MNPLYAYTIGSLTVHQRVTWSPSASTTRLVKRAKRSSTRGFSHAPSSVSHNGSVKWCSVTIGSMPRARSRPIISAYLRRAVWSNSPCSGSIRLHSTDSRRLLIPSSAARSKSAAAVSRFHQSVALPALSPLWMRPGCASHAAHWLLRLPPSFWCAAVATPHRKPSGIFRMEVFVIGWSFVDFQGLADLGGPCAALWSTRTPSRPLRFRRPRSLGAGVTPTSASASTLALASKDYPWSNLTQISPLLGGTLKGKLRLSRSPLPSSTQRV